jgi:hypothetical protein
MVYRPGVLLQGAWFRKLFANVHRARTVWRDWDVIQIGICTWEFGLVLRVHQIYTSNHHPHENHSHMTLTAYSRAYNI